jgi:hypothetical protein
MELGTLNSKEILERIKMRKAQAQEFATAQAATKEEDQSYPHGLGL